MGARLTRAKKKIAAARIPYRVPPPEELPARTGAVLTVVHLLFTTGHTAPTGRPLVRADLVERALDVARMLHELLPGDPQSHGTAGAAAADRQPARDPYRRAGHLVAARRSGPQPVGSGRHRAGVRARQGARCGTPARPLSRWRPPSPRCTPRRATWEATDWPQIVGLYDACWSPLAVAGRGAESRGGRQFRRRAGGRARPSWTRSASNAQLAGYAYLPAARADALRRLGRDEQARRPTRRRCC